MSPTRRNRHATIALTVGVAAVSWVLVTQLAGVNLTVKFPHSSPSSVAFGAVVAAAASATMAGWVLLAALERLVPRPLVAWRWLAAVVVLVSLSAPAAFATTLPAAAGLIAIHLAVGTTAVTGFSLAGRNVAVNAPTGTPGRLVRRSA